MCVKFTYESFDYSLIHKCNTFSPLHAIKHTHWLNIIYMENVFFFLKIENLKAEN